MKDRATKSECGWVSNGEESVNMRSVMYNMGPKMGSRGKKDEQLKRNLNDVLTSCSGEISQEGEKKTKLISCDVFTDC